MFSADTDDGPPTTNNPRSSRVILFLFLSLTTLLYLSSFQKALTVLPKNDYDEVLPPPPPPPSSIDYDVATTRSQKKPKVTIEKRDSDEQQLSVFPPRPLPRDDDQNIPPAFFFIAGFPRCGTTTLLRTFFRHPETLTSSDEYCHLSAAPDASMAIDNVTRHFQTLAATTNNNATVVGGSSSSRKQQKTVVPVKGIKCPMSIRNVLPLSRLLSSSSAVGGGEERGDGDVKLIIGLRHPVRLFESFYNYRVMELYQEQEQRLQQHQHQNRTSAPPPLTIPALEKPPTPEQLLSNPTLQWRDVSVDLVRLELSLMQLGKVALTRSDVLELNFSGRRTVLRYNSFRVFLYEVNQLRSDDDDYEVGSGNNVTSSSRRSREFRQSLQSYLGLTQEIPAFERLNVNNMNGSTTSSYPESIDICHGRFDELRRVLVGHGDRAGRWILEKFAKSDGVVVGGGSGSSSSREYFRELVGRWGRDPCAAHG